MRPKLDKQFSEQSNQFKKNSFCGCISLCSVDGLVDKLVEQYGALKDAYKGCSFDNYKNVLLSIVNINSCRAVLALQSTALLEEGSTFSGEVLDWTKTGIYHE